MASQRLSSFGRAWLALTLAFGAHVADEALTNFLSVYNPIVRSLRGRLGWFPMPEFTFGTWLTGLIVAVIVLVTLSRWAFRGAPAIRIAAYPYAVLMIVNGLGHLAGSAYFGRWLPGATTAPLLLAASIWLIVAARGARQDPDARRAQI